MIILFCIFLGNRSKANTKTASLGKKSGTITEKTTTYKLIAPMNGNMPHTHKNATNDVKSANGSPRNISKSDSKRHVKMKHKNLTLKKRKKEEDKIKPKNNLVSSDLPPKEKCIENNEVSSLLSSQVAFVTSEIVTNNFINSSNKRKNKAQTSDRTRKGKNDKAIVVELELSSIQQHRFEKTLRNTEKRKNNKKKQAQKSKISENVNDDVPDVSLCNGSVLMKTEFPDLSTSSFDYTSIKDNSLETNDESSVTQTDSNNYKIINLPVKTENDEVFHKENSNTIQYDTNLEAKGFSETFLPRELDFHLEIFKTEDMQEG